MGDHKAIDLRIQCAGEQCKSTRPIPTRRLDKPEHVQGDQWDEAVQVEWEAEEFKCMSDRRKVGYVQRGSRSGDGASAALVQRRGVA